MSFLARLFPFLFDDISFAPIKTDLQLLDHKDKARLISSPLTPLPVLAGLSRDKNEDIQILLAKRLATLIRKTKNSDRETTAMLLEAIRQLTEDSITPVRIALVSALKDVAHCPPDLAKKFADDIERQVSEPIIRYSLSLSDADLLDLITRHPMDWQTTTIAARKFVSSDISHAVIKTGNKQAGITLLDNDGAIIPDSHLDHLPQQDKAYKKALKKRNTLSRKIKREVFIFAQRSLHEFLQQQTQLDSKTTRRVIDTVQRRVALQDNHPAPDPATMSENDMKDALSIGNDDLVITAIAAQAKTSVSIARRMLIESQAAKPVIALCTKAGLSMVFAVLLQQRLARLPPSKIIYAKNGTENPLTPEEIQWQLEFFGVL